MLDIHQIRDALKDRRLDVVANATGLHRNTVSGIRTGKMQNPSYAAVKALSDYLQGTRSGDAQ